MLTTLNNPTENTSLRLNNEQLVAVDHTNGPLLVLAGAGTGKTRVLTAKILSILEQLLASNHEILAVTFTNKAAKEMLHRIAASGASHLPWLGTFHSIAAKILRSNASLIGLDENFTIIDADDQVRMVKHLLKESNIDSADLAPKYVVYMIQRWKDEGLLPEDIAQDLPFIEGQILKIYQIYQTRLKLLNAADFGDLLLYNIKLFESCPHILENYQRRFKYILVDEYQDTNAIQYKWLKLLADVHKNICCVGDEDQSIYGWRGAKIRNILQFGQDFPGALIVRLEQNYRSTGNILEAASCLISNNSERLGKKLWTGFDSGNKVKLIKAINDKDEANYVAKEIIKLKNNGYLLSNIAILHRSSAQTRNFEEIFLSCGIPYKVIGGQKFYARQEIRDVIAYLRLTNNPIDSFAFERIVNLPKRGVGQATVNKIINYADLHKISPLSAVTELINAGEIKGKAKASLEEFLLKISKWSSLIDSQNPSSLTEIILYESGYLDMWKAEKTIEAGTRLENIQELIKALGDFLNLGTFLDHVSLVSDNDAEIDGNMVSLMTIHASKGLEFDCIFFPCWEEGIFPNQRSLDESGNKGLEEERRLAYVGITRARKDLYISFCTNRLQYGSIQMSTPSRFIKELPLDKIESFATFMAAPQFTNASFQRQQRFPSKNNITQAQDSKARYLEGDRVFHDKFGYGIVTGTLGNQIEVNFKLSGYKTIMADYLKRT